MTLLSIVGEDISRIIEPDGSMSCAQLDSKIDLESYVTLLNYKIVAKEKYSYLKSRRDYIEQLYKDEFAFQEVRDILVHPKRGVRLHKKRYLNILNTLQSLGILDRDKNYIPSKQLELQGDLFEEYIYWLCYEIGFDDIAMGVKIDFDDTYKEPETNRRVYNEFDILMTYNNRIYTIECKFVKNLQGLDFVYKYDAIIDYFGKASKAIIANISPHEKQEYIGMKTSSNFRHSTLRRALMSGIAVYHESKVDRAKFKKFVRKFFGVK